MLVIYVATISLEINPQHLQTKFNVLNMYKWWYNNFSQNKLVLTLCFFNILFKKNYKNIIIDILIKITHIFFLELSATLDLLKKTKDLCYKMKQRFF